MKWTSNKNIGNLDNALACPFCLHNIGGQDLENMKELSCACLNELGGHAGCTTIYIKAGDRLAQ